MSPVPELNDYQLNAHAIACLLTSVVTLAFGVVVAFRQRRYRVGRLLGVLTLPIAWWQLAYGLMSSATTSGVALFWAHAAYLAIPLIAPAAYHFSVVLLRVSNRRRAVVWFGW